MTVGFKLSYSDLMELRRWNTPSVYNGWEAIAKRDRLEASISRESVIDFAPQMGPTVGYAVTVEYCAGSKKTSEENPDAYMNLYRYLVSIPGPKILMSKNLDAQITRAPYTARSRATPAGHSTASGRSTTAGCAT
jgi:hypothetical protein